MRRQAPDVSAPARATSPRWNEARWRLGRRSYSESAGCRCQEPGFDASGWRLNCDCAIIHCPGTMRKGGDGRWENAEIPGQARLQVHTRAENPCDEPQGSTWPRKIDISNRRGAALAPGAGRTTRD